MSVKLLAVTCVPCSLCHMSQDINERRSNIHLLKGLFSPPIVAVVSDGEERRQEGEERHEEEECLHDDPQEVCVFIIPLPQ